jgi:hypothetical protein
MSDKIKVKMIDNKSITTIKVNGSFLQRVNNVYFEYIEKIGLDAMNEILPHLKNDTLADITEPQLKLDAYNIEVLITLIKEIEASFDKAKLVNDVELDIPSED